MKNEKPRKSRIPNMGLKEIDRLNKTSNPKITHMGQLETTSTSRTKR